MSDSQPKVAFFKKGKSRPTTTRKRSPSPAAAAASAASTSSSAVVLPTRKAATNLLSAGSKRKRDLNDSEPNEDDTNGPDVKYTAAGSHAAAALEILAGDEAAELLAKRRRQDRIDAGGNSEEDSDPGPDDGKYHGQKAYKSHLKKTPQSEVPKAMRVGPQRASGSTIRTVTIVDYQPDVCKDYKETGYCGFGDTCKFLHDRGTYLAGWQLDNLAANAKKNASDESGSDSDSDDDIPFACLICRKSFTDPIVTKCGHYFCSACAIKRFAKTPKCRACATPTGGMFNRADKVIEKREKKRKDKEDKQNAEDDAGGKGKMDIEIEGDDSS